MFRFDFVGDSGDSMEVEDHVDNMNKAERHVFDPTTTDAMPKGNDDVDDVAITAMNWKTVNIDATYSLSIVETESLVHRDELKDILTTSDIRTGVYEGGFKLWECAIDLVRYLRNCSNSNNNNDFVFHEATKVKEEKAVVMELGCGHGLPGICALQMGAKHVIFMDYNHQVCTRVTAQNIARNLPAVDASRVSLYSGDWDAVSATFGSSFPPSCDLILTADTLYTDTVSRKLANMIRRHLGPHGVALVAAKKYYFGTGGNVNTFQAMIEEDPTYTSDIVWTAEDGQSNIRHIVRVRRRIIK